MNTISKPSSYTEFNFNFQSTRQAASFAETCAAIGVYVESNKFVTRKGGKCKAVAFVTPEQKVAALKEIRAFAKAKR